MTELSGIAAGTVSPNQLFQCAARDIKKMLVPMVHGAPAIGKSSVLHQLADACNSVLIDIRATTMEPIDVNGYPDINDRKRMEFFPPELIPLETDILPEGKNGWLVFFDELPSGSKEVEAALYKILLDRKVGNHNVHPKCRFMAAGNRIADGAIANKQGTATRTRLVHYELAPSVEDWLDWAVKKNIDIRIQAYMKFRPENLHKYDPMTKEYTFPAPRTWEFVHTMLTPHTPIDDIDCIRIAGAIGPATANDFISFASIYRDLPTIETILNNPNGWTVPEQPDRRYAITTMIAQATTPDNVQTLIKAISRLPDEFQIVTFQDMIRRKKVTKEHPAIATWVSKNAGKFF